MWHFAGAVFSSWLSVHMEGREHNVLQQHQKKCYRSQCEMMLLGQVVSSHTAGHVNRWSGTSKHDLYVGYLYQVIIISVFCFVFFLQLPDLVPQLGTLYQLMESRVKTFQKLSHLHGKLILLITQVSKFKCFVLKLWM